MLYEKWFPVASFKILPFTVLLHVFRLLCNPEKQNSSIPFTGIVPYLMYFYHEPSFVAPS